MKPSARQASSGDFLSAPFVAVPYELLKQFPELGIHSHEMIMLMQILAHGQVRGTTELSAQELGDLCGMSSKEVMLAVERLVKEELLGIGERWDDDGAHVTYFDLQPLWDRLRGKERNASAHPSWRQDPLTMFEEEFGRPLSALECDQLRTWLSNDGYPEWMIVEALRESVLANKYSFRYIDRVLFDWQRNRVQSRQDLEEYRQQHRDRVREPENRRKSGPSSQYVSKPANRSKQPSSTPKEQTRDERYANFYQLFPDS